MKGIYKITSPTGKVYIGQSKDIEKRFGYYRKLNCKRQKVLYNSLKAYGSDSHNFEILQTYDSFVNLDKEERKYYDIFKARGYIMMNSRIPGEKGNTHCSEETKKLISINKSKYKITQFSTEGKFIKIWNSVYEASKELEISQHNIRQNCKEKTKTAGGFIFRRGSINLNIIPPDLTIKYPNRKKRTVWNKIKNPLYQYDLEGKFIKEWFNAVVASEELSLNKGCISAACRGKIKQTGGFKWSKEKH